MAFNPSAFDQDAFDPVAFDFGNDSTPDAFSFPTQSGVERNAAILSSVVAITGLSAAATVHVANGEYRIDGGAWTSVDGSIDPGQQIQVRHISSAQFLGATTTTLTIGGVQGTFTSTTLADHVGGDIIPGRNPNRGHNVKRAKLRLKKDREHAHAVREIFRELTADPATRERAQEILPQQRTAPQNDRAQRLQRIDADQEIALRLLHRELLELQHRDDEEMVMELLGAVL